MSENCIVCESKASGRSSIRCGLCSGVSHLICIKPPIPSELLKFPGFLYKCTSCSDDTNHIKFGDKPSTSDSCMSKLMETLNNLNSKIDHLQTDLNVVKNQQKSLTESLEFYGNKIDDFTKKIMDFETKMKIIPKLESNVISATFNLNNLQDEVDQIQQQARMKNLEINGIPESSNENLSATVNHIFSILEIANTSYDFCFRVPHIDSKNRNPRSVIVKMVNKYHKDNVLAAIKKRKGIKLNEIGFAGQNSIYLNDHLTPKNKLLYKNTREFCKSSGAISWTRDCKIFIRLSKNGKTLHIHNESVLNKVKTSN